MAAIPDPPVGTAAGQTVERSFTNEYGTRAYDLYLPSRNRDRGPVPLVLMLHGCTQDTADLARGTRMNELAEAHGFLVVYPQQPETANPNRCWNWYEPDHQVRDRGEPALLAGLTQQIIAEYAVDASRVYVAGISAGGAMALVMAAAYPDLYAAVGTHSGVAYGAARSVEEAFGVLQAGRPDHRQRDGLVVTTMGERARRVPLIAFHGGADPLVNPVNLDQLVGQWVGAGDAIEGAPVPSRATRREGVTEAGFTYSVQTLAAAGRGDDPDLEIWLVQELGHAWSGGSPEGSFADPRGPDASREMIRFFLQHSR